MAGHAPVRTAQHLGSFGGFIDHPPRARARRMEKAHPAFADFQESDMGIEPHEHDAIAGIADFPEERIVVRAGAELAMIGGKEGAEDFRGWLLGQAVAVEPETGIQQDGGDEIAAGDGLRAGLAGGAVEIPGRAEPATHHFRQDQFEQAAGIAQDGRAFVGMAAGAVALGKFEPPAFQLRDEGGVGFGGGNGRGWGGRWCGGGPAAQSAEPSAGIPPGVAADGRCQHGKKHGAGQQTCQPAGSALPGS